MSETNEQLALSWVRKELNKSLEQARQGLEVFADNTSDVTQMRFCASCLHQVCGTLQMLEFRGATLFASELEALASTIAEESIDDVNLALETLMEGLLQLPAYLDRVSDGRRDLPVILLPMLNKLRALRGEAPVAESTLFSANVSSESPTGERPEVDADNFSEAAKKFRGHFQRGLLAVIRNQKVREGIQRMVKVLDRLQQETEGYPVSNLWSVAEGFIYAIADKGLYKEQNVQSLLGKIERHIKRLADAGIGALDDTIPDELLTNLLYYVAKSQSKHVKVAALKDRFDLAANTMSDEEIEEERQKLKGPDVGAIHNVVDAINEDLNNVKDTLDLFVRGQDKSSSKIAEMVPELKKISDTLGVLGLGIPRDVIAKQIDTLNKTLSKKGDISDALVMDVAGALLFVEANLSNVKPQQLGQLDEGDEEGLDDRQQKFSSNVQLDDAKTQLLKTSRNNLQRAKEKIVDFIASSFDFNVLDDVPSLISEIQGGLQIIGFEKAYELLAVAQEFIDKGLVEQKKKPEESVMDALADIITTVEYCLENFGEIGSEAFTSIIAASTESRSILATEVAKLSGESATDAPSQAYEAGEVEFTDLPEDLELTSKESDEEVSVTDETTANIPAQVDEQTATETSIEEQPLSEQKDDTPDVTSDTKPEPVVYASSQPSAEKAHDESLIDDDVLEIFLEEAEEELASINEQYPILQQDPKDEEALTTIRRSFHTLKGSGRLVGASIAGELAWSIENMLNRVLDETIPLDQNVFRVMRDAIDFMPELVEAFSEKKPPENTPDRIMANAQALSAGEKPNFDQDTKQAIAEPSVAEEPTFESEQSGLDAAAEEDLVDVIDNSPSDEEALSDHAPEPDEPLESIPELTETDEVPELSDSVSDTDFAPVGVDDVLEISEDLTQQPDEDDIPTLDVEELEPFDEVEDPVASTMDHRVSEDISNTETSDSRIDPVLLEIFVTEADSHLTTVQNEIDQWRDGSKNFASDALLRAMHTLKGSANMAEVDEIATVVSPLESLVKELRQREIPLSDEFKTQLPVAHQYLKSCISHLNNGTHYQDPLKDSLADNFNEQLNQIIAHQQTDTEQASKAQVQRDPELLGIFLTEGMDIVSEAKALLGQWQKKGSLDAQHNLQAEMHTLKRGANMAMVEEVETLASALERFVSNPNQTTGDQSYQELGDKALDLVMDQLNAVAAEQYLPTPAELVEQLRNWKSTTIVQDDIAEPKIDTTESQQEVTETIRPQDVVESEDEIDEELVDLFIEEADELTDDIEAQIEKWRDNLGDLLPVNNLQRNLHTLKGSARMAGLMSVGNLSHALEDLYEAISVDKVKAIQSHVTLSLKVLDEIRRVCELLRDGKSFTLDHHLLERVRAAAEGEVVDFSEDTTEVEDSQQQQESISDQLPDAVEAASESSVEELSVEQSQDLSADASVQIIKLDEEDEEVLEIYLEEAQEILQNMDSALHEWAAEPTDKNAIETLQRSLHTLKGGARLSSLTALGDLTHEIETYFEQVADGKITAADEQVQFVLRGYDVIYQMVDEVENKKQLTTPVAYMDELDRVIKGKQSTSKLSESVKEKAEVVPISKPQAKPTTVEDIAQQVERKVKQQEVVRIAADQLEDLVNLSGETSIFRARLEQQVSVLRYNLDEMNQAIDRLRDQLRNMEIETDAQIEYRREVAAVDYEEFDPLEFDRYTRQQELTRSLGESASDIASVKESLDNIAADAETLLLQQGRVNTEMSERLMRTRMVPFESLVPRLRRIVRQIGNELDKAVDLSIVAEGEMDRTVLERMIAPIEHMLRNAMDHGIESISDRKKLGKTENGKVRIRLYREGSEIFIEIQDDGRGLDIDAIRKKAIERGLIKESSELSDFELQQLIFEAGFSTAQKVTQISGRGVGMDVVSSEIKQMGGVVEINSEVGKGTTFTVKLPFTVSVNQALMINVGDDVYAVPLTNIEGIVRVSPYEIQEYYNNPEAKFEYAGVSYDLRYMGNLFDHNLTPDLQGVTKPLPILLLHGAEHPTAVQVDELMGSREIVVKSVGQQLSLLSGLSGATILGDGRVVLILDVPALTRRADAILQVDDGEQETFEQHRAPTVMVVDDSITVRKVTQRLLQRYDYEVILAKDGVDALNVLSDAKPDVMLLDIEMPRMDGFELATILRHDDKTKELPIIMITSRTGEKHRERALSIGVNHYMGKPYNEVDLLQTIESLLETK